MRQLLVNKRPILPDIARWVEQSPGDMGLVTARSSVTQQSDLDAAVRSCLFVDVVDDYMVPAVDELIVERCRQHGIEGLMSLAESDVERCARIREQLDLPGQLLQSAEAYRDKYVMKTLAAAAGIPVPPMAALSDAEELAHFLSVARYPLVLKPRRGGASIGIVMARDPAAFEAHRSRLAACEQTGNYQVECFTAGRTYHVDGLMRDGLVEHAWPSLFLHTQWQTMYRSLPLLSGMLGPNDKGADPLREATERTVAALPSAPFLLPFHAEFFMDDENRPILCEIACRAGGAGHDEVYTRSFGVGMNEAMISERLGRTVRPADRPAVRHGCAWFPPRQGRLLGFPRICPLRGAVRYRAKAVPGTGFHRPASVSDSIAELIFALDDGELVSQLEEINGWWTANCCHE
ncbi:acetyl-CoA carboxylase biotin carboxylase subunit family protein [Streptomyces sp. NPDC056831]|uniref:ATP-grasp domain-containing protein n=1 Tax=Streptomyces sp. NPDC056831 TaxID=3345954 RepID=UPI00369B6EBD